MIGGAGRQRLNIEGDRKARDQRMRKRRKEEDSRSQSPSYTPSHRIRSKEKFIEIGKGKNQETKDRWYHLSKEKQARNKPD